MSDDNQIELVDSIPDAPVVESAPAEEFKPLVCSLWEGTEGIIAVVPANGELHSVVAIDLACAEEIIKLAMPDAKVGKSGYAKTRPHRGDPVWFQVPVIEPNPKMSSGKDLAEATRRAAVNYERRGF